MCQVTRHEGDVRTGRPADGEDDGEKEPVAARSQTSEKPVGDAGRGGGCAGNGDSPAWGCVRLGLGFCTEGAGNRHSGWTFYKTWPLEQLRNILKRASLKLW